jgi:NADH-quinone oxidoreductase subunit G
MSDIEIEIDGKPLKAKPNSMVIQVADEAGIYIPRFCYHKHLSVAANCRMCLVEVEKSPKALPACATPVMPGMKVFTRSTKALTAQKAVMEFLLINHPLDCPICDQGGECELQDLSMGYGSPDSYYNQGKRSVKDKNLGPLISSDMTRCIQCTRCVRFGDEIAGLRELGGTGRGEHLEIGTYVQHAMHSEVSGNIIDVCPVGALTSKPYRFTARPWELKQYPSVAAHDCVGSAIYLHTRNGVVMRTVPRENANINETWISDRDRYSYQGLSHADRIAKPKIKRDGQWHETDWETALAHAAKILQENIHHHGTGAIGALASPSATTEEFYVLQKMLRQLGSGHIDHRLRQVDFSDQDAMPLFPGINQSIADIENNELIVLLGSNIQKEQPSAALRVRKAYRKGAEVIAINMMDYRFHFDTVLKKIVAPHNIINTLLAITKILTPQDIHADVEITEMERAIAAKLTANKKTSILLGASAQNHPMAATIRSLAAHIAKASGATLGILTEGANSAGGWIAGAIPHRAAGGRPVTESGLDAKSMLTDPKKAYVLLNVEPDVDCANPLLMQQALAAADCVISLSMFSNAMVDRYAHVILPITPFTETGGTFINAAGQWQTFTGVTQPFGESRPAWKVLRVFANFLHLEGFDYPSSEQILQELRGFEGSFTERDDKRVGALGNVPVESTKDKTKLSRIGDIPIYATDSIVRRAEALQATQTIIEGEVAAVRMHPRTAEKLLLSEGEQVFIKQHDNTIQLPVVLDMKVPLEAVFIAGGISATCDLSELFGWVEVYK